MNNEHSEQLHAFLHSYDFMKLGQAINKNQWQIAAMTIQRMTKQALAVVISKRVKLIGEEKTSLCSDDKDR